MAIHEFQKMLHTFKDDFNSMHVAIITALRTLIQFPSGKISIFDRIPKSVVCYNNRSHSKK